MPKRTRLAKVTATVLLSLFLLVGCSSSTTTPPTMQGEGKPGTGKPTVKVAIAKRTDLTRTLLLSGKITPAAETPIIAKYTGIVRSVNVEMGQRVEKNQVLVIQDTTDAELTTITAEASFQAGYEKAKTDFQLAQAQFERYRNLYDQQAVSKATMEAEQQKVAAARAALESWTRQMVGGTVPASVDLLKRKQEDMILRAPFGGIIAQKQVNPGEQVTATQSLMMLVDMSKIYIDCSVAESDVGSLTVGLPLVAAVESAWQSYKGSITHISPIADPKTKTFFVRVTLEAPDEKLKGGMYARFAVSPVVRSSVVAVPLSALIEQGAEYFVFVIKQDETLEKRKVEIGFREETNVEIRSGLQEGQRVVAEVMPNFRDKMAVQVAVPGGNPSQGTPNAPQGGGKGKP